MNTKHKEYRAVFRDTANGQIITCEFRANDVWEFGAEYAPGYLAGGAMLFRKERYLPSSLFSEGDELFKWNDITLMELYDRHEGHLTDKAMELITKYPEGSIISLDAYIHGGTAVHPTRRNPMTGDWDTASCVGLWFPHSCCVALLNENKDVLSYLKLESKFKAWTGRIFKDGKVVWEVKDCTCRYTLVRQASEILPKLIYDYGTLDKVFDTLEDANENFVLVECEEDCALVTDYREAVDVITAGYDLTGNLVDEEIDVVTSYSDAPYDEAEANVYALTDYMNSEFARAGELIWPREMLANYIRHQPEFKSEEE